MKHTRKSLALDGVDSGFVLGLYAWLVGAVGCYVALWGNFGLVHSNDDAALMRTGGVFIVFMAITAAGLSRIDSPIERRRSLGWFTAAHFAMMPMLVAQRIAIWGSGPSDVALAVLFLVTASLFYAWSAAGGDASCSWPRRRTFDLFLPGRLLSRTGSGTVGHLRSTYEEQIRQAAAQEERHRLARDLHDSVKQQIFAVQTAAATAEARLAGDQAGARDALDTVRAGARDAMAEMEAMTEQLRAAPLENDGLIAALRHQTEAFKARTGATLDVHIGRLPSNERMAPGSQQTIFRVAQEALSNVARHARASHVTVSIEKAGSSVELVVTDDGSGYEPGGSTSGAGLRNMQDRADEVGGDVTVGRNTRGGTTVRFTVPFLDADTRRYRKLTLGYAAGIAILGIVSALTWRRNGPYTNFYVIFMVFECLRYGHAWWRARQLDATDESAQPTTPQAA